MSNKITQQPVVVNNTPTEVIQQKEAITPYVGSPVVSSNTAYSKSSGKKEVEERIRVGNSLSNIILDSDKTEKKVKTNDNSKLTFMLNELKALGLKINKKDITSIINAKYLMGTIIKSVHKISKEEKSITFNLYTESLLKKEEILSHEYRLSDNFIVDKTKINLGKIPYSLHVFDNDGTSELKLKINIIDLVYDLMDLEDGILSLGIDFTKDVLTLDITFDSNKEKQIQILENIVIFVSSNMLLDKFENLCNKGLEVKEIDMMLSSKVDNFIPQELMINKTYIPALRLGDDLFIEEEPLFPGLPVKRKINQKALIASVIPTYVDSLDKLKVFKVQDKHTIIVSLEKLVSIINIFDANTENLKCKVAATKIVNSELGVTEKVISMIFVAE